MRVQPDAADIHLLREAQAGDAEAFGVLYERYATPVYRFLSAHLNDHLDAEDMTGEVFLRAWRSLPSYREQGYPFSSFLFRIARNVLVDRYRSNGFKEQDLPEEGIDDHYLEADPSELILLSFEGHELRRLLASMKEDYRTVLAARFLSGLSPEETAVLIDKSVGAVRVIQHRALNQLRKLLTEAKEAYEYEPAST